MARAPAVPHHPRQLRQLGLSEGPRRAGEQPEAAALREVSEETGIERLTVRTSIDTIDWYFRFRGRLIHKVCHFYLMVTELADTSPQRSRASRHAGGKRYEQAAQLVSYANARDVLRRAHDLLTSESTAS
jgi:8-oxo-dGTP pyrophosphatase MutT (NUDIX family)